MKKLIILPLFVLSIVFNVYGSGEPAKKKIKFVLKRTDDDQRVMMATARLYEICKGDLDVRFDIIAEGADVNCTDFGGFTPIYYAVVNGNVKRVDQLCNSGTVDMNVRYGADHESILHVAALGYNSKKTVRSLLKLHAPMNAVDKEGNNAAHYAMSDGNFGVANLLAERGVNLTQRNKDDKRPIDCCVGRELMRSEYLLYKQIRALTVKQARN